MRSLIQLIVLASFAPVSSCTSDLPLMPDAGSIQVSVVTKGIDPDPDGYSFVLGDGTEYQFEENLKMLTGVSMGPGESGHPRRPT
jgi:hypothetical protein